METVEQEKASLISGIEAEARVEEERIISEAEHQASEKRQYADTKVESILNEARRKAAEQAEMIKRKVMSEVELEIKRRSLRVQDAVMQEIISRVEGRLRAMIDRPEYRAVLVDWITEAAVGLDAASAKLNASDKERALIDNGLIWEAREKMRQQTGKEVEVTISDSPPLGSQGVVLTAADGRVAFNNRVRTRLLRNQRGIRAMIYEALFSDGRKEQL